MTTNPPATTAGHTLRDTPVGTPPHRAPRIRRADVRASALAGEREGEREVTARPGLRARLRPFQTPVRGHAFAAAPGGVGGPEEGLRARLAREPSNPADPLAVAVWVESPDDHPWRIGYLDRGVAARVAPRLDDGLHLDARIDGWVTEPEGRWHRPLVLLVPDAADRAQDRSGSAAGPCEPDLAGEPVWRRPPGVTRRRLRQRPPSS